MSDGRRAGVNAALAGFALALALAATSVANGHPYETALSVSVYVLVLVMSYLLVRSSIPLDLPHRGLQLGGFAASAALSLIGAAWTFGPGDLSHPGWVVFGPYCMAVAMPLFVVGHLAFHTSGQRVARYSPQRSAEQAASPIDHGA